MPLNEIPRYLNPDTRRLVEDALEKAWRELSEGSDRDPAAIRAKLRRTIVALASVGETEPGKLKQFAIYAWQGAIQAEGKQAA